MALPSNDAIATSFCEPWEESVIDVVLHTSVCNLFVILLSEQSGLDVWEWLVKSLVGEIHPLWIEPFTLIHVIILLYLNCL